MNPYRYDRKLEEEIRNYDPFGRGGGGAPMKDRQGNVIGNILKLHIPFLLIIQIIL